MSHSSSQTAVSSVDCGSRDLNARYKMYVHKNIHLHLQEKKKNQTVLSLDLIAGSSLERVFTTNRSGKMDREKNK